MAYSRYTLESPSCTAGGGGTLGEGHWGVEGKLDGAMVAYEGPKSPGCSLGAGRSTAGEVDSGTGAWLLQPSSISPTWPLCPPQPQPGGNAISWKLSL